MQVKPAEEKFLLTIEQADYVLDLLQQHKLEEESVLDTLRHDLETWLKHTGRRSSLKGSFGPGPAVGGRGTDAPPTLVPGARQQYDGAAARGRILDHRNRGSVRFCCYVLPVLRGASLRSKGD